MPTKKSKRTEILADIVRALRDKNTVIQIQTMGTYRREDTRYFDGAEHTPAYKGGVIGFIDGHKMLANARDVVSIKINDDIQIHKKVNLYFPKPSRYIVHTPHGEISLSLLDSDMELLWDSSMHIYEEQIGVTPNGFARAHQEMKRYLDNPELRKILDAPVVEKVTKSKKEQAKEKMKALGIKKTKNLDKYIADKAQEAEIMADIVRALLDENTTILVQTVDGDHIPTREGKFRTSFKISENSANATSITINDDIKIRKKQDMFIIHTPHGEMKTQYSFNDDIFLLWTAALLIYDSQNNGDRDTFPHAKRMMMRNLYDPELRKIAESPIKPLDTRSKYEKAKAKMKALGVTKTKNMDAYIAQQQAKAQSK